MTPMQRAQFKRQLEVGLNAAFGMRYKQFPEQWKQFFEIKTSDKAFEEQIQEMGLGAGRVKAEGAGVAYDNGRELWASRFVHDTVALAFAITEEAEEDGQYGSLGAKYSKSLARSMQYTKEIGHAAILNNGYDPNFKGGDAQPLFSLSHPLGAGGTFANMLATPADLSETALEALAILVGTAVDDRGMPAMLTIKKLGLPTELQFVARRILESEGRVETSDNDINALKKAGTIPDWAVWRFLTDPDAYFVTTDAEGGLQHFKRKGIQRGVEGDFNTGNMRYKARERYSKGWHEPRGVFGSQGAS